MVCRWSCEQRSERALSPPGVHHSHRVITRQCKMDWQQKEEAPSLHTHFQSRYGSKRGFFSQGTSGGSLEYGSKMTVVRLHCPLPLHPLLNPPTPAPHIVRDMRAPLLLPSLRKGQGPDSGWDLQSQLGALPTKKDMEKFVTNLRTRIKKP